jgi:hypothetical protein
MAGDVQPESNEASLAFSRQMRDMARATAGRPLRDDPAALQRETLTALLAEAEDAKKAGDADKLIEITDTINKLVDEGPSRDPATGQFTVTTPSAGRPRSDWGAGVRRPIASRPNMSLMLSEMRIAANT